MRKIVEEGGRFYIEETIKVAEVSIESLESKLAEVRKQKDETLVKETLTYDTIISDLESDLAKLQQFQQAMT